jgi:hypothetical protein
LNGILRFGSMGGVGPDAGQRGARWRSLAVSVLAGAATILVAIAVAALYLRRYPDGQPVLTHDLPHYLWRSRLVSALGLHTLVGWHPAHLGILPERSGFPVLLGLLDVSGSITLVLATRAVFAVVVGLAAGAFALDVLGERWFALPVFLLGVGASAQLARTGIGYLDNLVVDAAVMVTAVAALVAVSGRRGRVLAIAGMGAAMLTHWFFALLFLALLAGVAVVLVPTSIRAARSGLPRPATPSWRLGTVVVGSAVACAISALVAPTFPTRLPPPGGGNTRGGGGDLKSSAPLWLPQTLPLAGAGAVALWWPRSVTRRAGLALAAMWAASVPLGMAVSAARSGHHLAIFRISAFALGIPLLIGAAVVAATTLPRWRWLRVIGGAAGAVVLVVLFVHSASLTLPGPEGRLHRALDQAAIAGAYLEQTSGDRPVVFLTGGASPREVDGVARSEVPPRLIEDTWIYPGTFDDLQLGGPSTDTTPRVESQSRGWWRQVWTDPQAVLRRDPIVLYLRQFNPVLPPPATARQIQPGVLVVHGPPPGSAAAPQTPPATPGPGGVRWAVVGMLLLLFAAGSGWSVALLGGSWAGRAALAPAVGSVALILVGSVLGRLGLAVTGASAWIVLAAVAASGWGTALIPRRPAGRRPLMWSARS